jgi:nucleotide-binding universal stress UspA family protein
MNIQIEEKLSHTMVKRIMVCLDGSKNSLRGLDKAISFAKESGALIVGVHSDTTFSAFSAVRTPILPTKKWKQEAKKLMNIAQKKVEKNKIEFEGIVIGGHTSGIDLTTFANNPGNRIDQIVIGSRGMGFPKELFFGSTSNFVLHKAKAPVTVVK